MKPLEARTGRTRVAKAGAELEKSLSANDEGGALFWLPVLSESVQLLSHELQALSNLSNIGVCPNNNLT